MIFRARTELGALRLRVPRVELHEPGRALLERFAAEGARVAAPVELAGIRAWAKGGPLRASAGLRYGARRLLLGRPLPREREYRNLAWLRERLFQAVEPLVAGSVTRAGRPRYQLLVTALEEGAKPFEGLFEEASGAERRAWLDELARELSRMHALHFVHRDVFPRNLLVKPPGPGRRLVFLDAWAGGPGPGRRGPAYDLACWFLEPDRFRAEESDRFWNAYLEGLRAQGARPRPDLARRVLRAREGLLARLRREPARLRGRAFPGPWSPPTSSSEQEQKSLERTLPRR